MFERCSNAKRKKEKKNRQNVVVNVQCALWFNSHRREFMNFSFSRLFLKCLKDAQMQKEKKNRQNVVVNVQCALWFIRIIGNLWTSKFSRLFFKCLKDAQMQKKNRQNVGNVQCALWFIRIIGNLPLIWENCGKRLFVTQAFTPQMISYFEGNWE